MFSKKNDSDLLEIKPIAEPEPEEEEEIEEPVVIKQEEMFKKNQTFPQKKSRFFEISLENRIFENFRENIFF